MRDEDMVLEAPGFGVADRGTYSHELLVSPWVWNQLVTFIGERERVPFAFAERIMNEALKVINITGREHRRVPPPPLVAVGWEAFVLHTQEYTSFCSDRYGRVIPYAPDDPGVMRDSSTASAEALAEAGYELDMDLWTHEFAEADEPRRLVPIR